MPARGCRSSAGNVRNVVGRTAFYATTKFYDFPFGKNGFAQGKICNINNYQKKKKKSSEIIIDNAKNCKLADNFFF